MTLALILLNILAIVLATVIIAKGTLNVIQDRKNEQAAITRTRAYWAKRGYAWVDNR